MKIIKFITCPVLFVLCLFSCHKEPYEDIENKIRVVVECNIPKAPVHIFTSGYQVTVKGGWEQQFVTKDEYIGVEATCEDSDALITVEVYVNGHLKDKFSKNGFVKTKVIQLK